MTELNNCNTFHLHRAHFSNPKLIEINLFSIVDLICAPLNASSTVFDMQTRKRAKKIKTKKPPARTHQKFIGKTKYTYG